jgi:hypothetical protein
MRAFAVVITVAFAAVAAAPAVAQSDLPGPVAPVADGTPIAAYGGHLVFSRADGHGRFQLVQRVGDGPVTALPVPSRAVPFDVDVGPTAGGRILAVYSRCTTEPQGELWGIPAYEQARGCDIYEVDLAGGPEQRLRAVNATDAAETWPTYWKGRLAFARTYDAKPAEPVVYVKTLASRRPSQRLPGGTLGRTRSVATGLELYGTRLAFSWRIQGNAEGPTYQLRLDTIGGGHRVMDRANNGGLTAIVLGWPSFEEGRLYWARACFGDPGGCPGRERLSSSTYTGTITELEATAPKFVLSHERAGRATTLLTDASGVADCKGDPPTASGTCSITTSRPDFRPRN